MTNEAKQAYRALRRLLRAARELIAFEEGGRREKTKADQQSPRKEARHD